MPPSGSAAPLATVPAVRITGLGKRFGTTVALDGIDLEVRAGELRGLLGPNGAGKTTLLRALFGLIRPDAGSLELFGRPVTQADPAPLGRVGGFVEDPSFYPYLTGRENLKLLVELDGSHASNRIDEILERVDLTARADHRVGGYSTGMRQRLGIAAALIREPRLLLLDEPTSGLDPAGTRAVTALVRELSAAGVAVLLCSHHIGDLEALCDAYTVLRDGQIVWDGTAAELREQAPPSDYALSTSDDVAAVQLAGPQPGVQVEPEPEGGLVVHAAPTDLDRYVIALGRADIAVRRLEQRSSPLETMFFALTGHPSSD